MTERASFANLLRPPKIERERRCDKHSFRPIQPGKQTSPQDSDLKLTLGVLLDGLFERGDVPEGAEEEHDDVALVLDGRDLQEEP